MDIFHYVTKIQKKCQKNLFRWKNTQSVLFVDFTQNKIKNAHLTLLN